MSKVKKTLSKKRKYDDMSPSAGRPRTATLANARVYQTKRTASTAAFTQVVGQSTLALEFKLNNLPNFNEFTALFDFYRIDKVTVHLYPRINSNDNPNSYQCLFSVVDYDGNPPTTLALAYQNENLKIWNGRQPIHISLKPRILSGALAGAVVVAGGTRQSEWLDCNAADVTHYGLALFVDSLQAGGVAQTWDIFIDYHLSFKHTR